MTVVLDLPMSCYLCNFYVSTFVPDGSEKVGATFAARSQ